MVNKATIKIDWQLSGDGGEREREQWKQQLVS